MTIPHPDDVVVEHWPEGDAQLVRRPDGQLAVIWLGGPAVNREAVLLSHLVSKHEALKLAMNEGVQLRKCLSCEGEYRLVYGPVSTTEYIGELSDERDELKGAIADAAALFEQAGADDHRHPPEDHVSLDTWAKVEDWLARDEVVAARKEALGVKHERLTPAEQKALSALHRWLHSPVGDDMLTEDAQDYHDQVEAEGAKDCERLQTEEREAYDALMREDAAELARRGNP